MPPFLEAFYTYLRILSNYKILILEGIYITKNKICNNNYLILIVPKPTKIKIYTN